MDFLNVFLTTIVISFIIQIIFFAFAAKLKTDKVTDLAYGSTFALIAFYWILRNLDNVGFYEILLAAMVSIWGIRLSGYLFYRILKTGTDKRFDDKRGNPLEFAKFWTLQAVAIALISTQMVYIITQTPNDVIAPIAIIGVLGWLIGLAIESVADMQLYNFRFNKPKTGKWIEEGLWKYSRHPNYYGEIIVWWSLFFYGINNYEGTGWLAVVSPIFITLLLLFVSGVPLLEKANDKRWGDKKDYQRYKNETNLIILGPKKS